MNYLSLILWYRTCTWFHGASLSFFQWPSGWRVYTMRSWSRLGLPCQNSIRSGMTAYPPQWAGRSTSFPIQPAATQMKARISCTRLPMGWLCGDIRAPIRLLYGRFLKYWSDSSGGTFSAVPSICTCLSNWCHTNEREIAGFCASCLPFRLS